MEWRQNMEGEVVTKVEGPQGGEFYHSGWLPWGPNSRLGPEQLACWCQTRRWALSRQHVKVKLVCKGPRPHPNSRLPLKHVSLTKQLMKHKEPWITPVSHFKPYRIIRKNLSWQSLPGLHWQADHLCFPLVCCRHSNCKAPNTGPGCHFLMHLGSHTEIALWTQQCLFLSCCAVVPQSKKQALKWVTEDISILKRYKENKVHLSLLLYWLWLMCMSGQGGEPHFCKDLLDKQGKLAVTWLSWWCQ